MTSSLEVRISRSISVKPSYHRRSFFRSCYDFRMQSSKKVNFHDVYICLLSNFLYFEPLMIDSEGAKAQKEGSLWWFLRRRRERNYSLQISRLHQFWAKLTLKWLRTLIIVWSLAYNLVSLESSLHGISPGTLQVLVDLWKDSHYTTNLFTTMDVWIRYISTCPGTF